MDEYSERDLCPRINDEEVRSIRASHRGKGYSIQNRRGYRKFSKWFVIACSCGFETPLCDSGQKAKELFAIHRINERRKLRATTQG